MKKKEYVHPKMHIYAMSKMQLLAGSGETLNDFTDGDAEFYDLNGKRQTDLQRGVNIVKRNGKTMKVIIK